MATAEERRNMRKLLLASLLAVAIGLDGGPATAAPPEPGVVRPTCADIEVGGGLIRPADETGTGTMFVPALDLAGPACPGLTYTIYILDDDTEGAEVLAVQSVSGSRDEIVTFADMVYEDDDPVICVYSTSSAGAHMFDRLDEVGCTMSDRVGRVDYWWFP
jgi:hypothetical protein